MAFDHTKSFEIGKDGLLIDGGVLLASGSDSPVGYQAPTGSIYYQTDGSIWKKIDTGVNDWEKQDIQAKFASPGYNWGDRGNLSAGAYLLNASVPSNNTGIPATVNGIVSEVSIANSDDNATAEVGFYKRVGSTFTLLTSITLTNARRAFKTITTTISISAGDELACKIISGSLKDPVATLNIKETAT